MAGKILAACVEHEAAAKLVAEGDVLPPEPALALAMDTNFGIRYVDDEKSFRKRLLYCSRATYTCTQPQVAQSAGEMPLTLTSGKGLTTKLCKLISKCVFTSCLETALSVTLAG